MSIQNPILYPKAGYVEVVDENGNHVYKPTPETEARLKKDTQLANVSSQVDQILGTTEFQEPQAALEFRKAVQLFAATLTDEASLMTIASVYPPFYVGYSYKTGDIFSYGVNGVGDPQLYQVLQDHTSSEEWTPDTASSLYKKVGMSEDGTPIWVQPLGATDAYNTGDQVMYNGEKYESLIDANVWSPEAYPAGWKKVTDTEPEPEPEDPDPEEPTDIPEFVQPTGAHDAYNTGDQVRYNGQVYESLIDANVWSPEAYPQGWKLIK